jgi:hypothetical protein
VVEPGSATVLIPVCDGTRRENGVDEPQVAVVETIVDIARKGVLAGKVNVEIPSEKEEIGTRRVHDDGDQG